MHSSAIPDIRPFIANDQSAVRYYFAFTLIVIAIGLVIVGLSFVPPFKSTDSLADIAQKAFGGVFSCLSWIPIKELLARCERSGRVPKRHRENLGCGKRSRDIRVPGNAVALRGR
jgi:hypothetical protein